MCACIPVNLLCLFFRLSFTFTSVVWFHFFFLCCVSRHIKKTCCAATMRPMLPVSSLHSCSTLFLFSFTHFPYGKCESAETHCEKKVQVMIIIKVSCVRVYVCMYVCMCVYVAHSSNDATCFSIVTAYCISVCAAMDEAWEIKCTWLLCSGCRPCSTVTTPQITRINPGHYFFSCLTDVTCV